MRDVVIAGAGLALALSLPPLIEIGTDKQETVAIAIAVIVFQGFYFWWSRREQRELLRQTQLLLHHKVRNALQALMVNVPPGSPEREEYIAAIARVLAALDDVELKKVHQEMQDLELLERGGIRHLYLKRHG